MGKALGQVLLCLHIPICKAVQKVRLCKAFYKKLAISASLCQWPSIFSSVAVTSPLSALIFSSAGTFHPSCHWPVDTDQLRRGPSHMCKNYQLSHLHMTPGVGISRKPKNYRDKWDQVTTEMLLFLKIIFLFLIFQVRQSTPVSPAKWKKLSNWHLH